MKLMIKLCVLVLILGLTAPFFIKGPNGRPLFSLPNFSSIQYKVSAWWRDLRSDAKQIGNKLSPPEDSKPSKVYKWQDESGTWHFSEAPNEQGHSEEIWVDPDTNVVQATEITQAKPEQEGQESHKTPNNLPLPMSLPAQDVQQLMEDANNVQQLMDNHAQKLNEI